MHSSPITALFDFINGFYDGGIAPVEGYLMRQHYMAGPQYCCPVLDAMEEDETSKLAQALIKNEGVLSLTLRQSKKMIPAERFIEMYPRIHNHFFYVEAISKGNTVRLDCKDALAQIRSITCEAYLPMNWEKKTKKRRKFQNYNQMRSLENCYKSACGNV